MPQDTQFPPRAATSTDPRVIAQCAWATPTVEARLRAEISEMQRPSEQIAYLREHYLRGDQSFINRQLSDLKNLAPRMPWQEQPTDVDVERALAMARNVEFNRCTTARR